MSCDKTDENGNLIYDCGTSNFIIVGYCGNMNVMVHKETGVMYLFLGAHGGAGVTVMVDSDGKPLIWEEYKQEVQNGEDKG